MSNMSYCRFENTSRDLRDCEDNLFEEISSEEEIDARKGLVKTCADILEKLWISIDESELNNAIKSLEDYEEESEVEE